MVISTLKTLAALCGLLLNSIIWDTIATEANKTGSVRAISTLKAHCMMLGTMETSATETTQTGLK